MYTLLAVINGESTAFESDDLKELEIQAICDVLARDEGDIEVTDIKIIDKNGNNVMNDAIKEFIGA